MKHIITVNNPEESRDVQNKLFGMGFQWEISKKNVSHTHGDVLYAEHGIIRYGNLSVLLESTKKYIRASDFLFILPEGMFEL